MGLSISDKKKIVDLVKSHENTVTEVSRKFCVSRKTIYQWLHAKSLKSNYRSGKKHPNAIYPKVYPHINRMVYSHPDWSLRRFKAELKKKNIFLSHVQIGSLLERIGAESYDRRVNYKRNFAGPGRVTSDIRLEIVRKVTEGESITDLSNKYNIARKTIYFWVKRYKSLGNLNDNYVLGLNHRNAVYPKITGLVLEAIVKHPEYSVRKLSKFVHASSWVVWRVLHKNNLFTQKMRMEYSLKKSKLANTFSFFDRVKNTLVSFLTPNLLPSPPNKEVFKIFTTSFIASTFTSIFIFTLISQITSLGILFAYLAFAFGLFFFLYSVKYYITLAITLSYMQNENSYCKSSGLRQDINCVNIDSYPFVSVHIPFYNEKNVVERSIKSAINFDYPGKYEIILCDDSNDDTSDIIKTIQERYVYGAKLNIIKDQNAGWSLSSVEVKPGIFLKHLHRDKRDGFKGGALQLALKIMNPKTEYISVFDADFVPYPDTLQLFLKYFQVSEINTNNTNSQLGIGDHLKFGIGNSAVAAVQGYQWHVLNKSENWITRGVRSEYSGSYVVERSGAEIYGGLKQISGSVYMIKKDVLSSIGWGRSITEDFELTLKLYEKGYKVLYTPYVQAPAECVSTLKRLIRQRMRWAEGHSFNVKKMFAKLMLSPNLTKAEKLEFLYLTPYYLQAFFFLVGTLSWFTSEIVFRVQLPFWTEIWGWSLILTNMIALPLVNGVGLFLEESEQKDYSGLGSFILLSYIVVPFQAYAAIKGFIEKEEGPWFRTPKTGRITDMLTRNSFVRFVQDIIPKLHPINNFKFNFNFRFNPKALIIVTMIITTQIVYFSQKVQLIDNRVLAKEVDGSSQTPNFYKKLGNSYIYSVKGDPKDRIEVKVGDENENKFIPVVDLYRWDGEVNLSLKLKDIDEGDETSNFDGEKVTWTKGHKEVNFYNLLPSESFPDGGYEFEITLDEKPTDNKVEFDLKSKNLEFLYQPPLNQEALESGQWATETEIYDIDGNIISSRPENIVGSYAVYYKNAPPNIEGGKIYKNGKAFQIYRPKIFDADGRHVWGELNIDEKKNILSVTIPQEFLDNATYPITHAAGLTLGYVSGCTNGSGSPISSNVYATQYTTDNNAGNKSATSQTWCINSPVSGTNLKVALYSDSGNLPYQPLASGTSGTIPSGQSFVTVDFDTPYTLSASTPYWLAGRASTATTNTYYDTGSLLTKRSPTTYANFPDNPFNTADTLYTTRRYWVYTTYTAEDVPENNWVLFLLMPVGLWYYRRRKYATQVS